MAALGYDNLHSRLVTWLKILLPLLALALLSSLFFLSGKVGPADAIPYAEVDIADLIRQPRLTDAAFAGMTSDGAALTLKAGVARPGVAGSATAAQASLLSGLLETPDGARTVLTAAAARLDQATQQMVLSGGVVLSNSAGYRVETPGLTLALDRTALDSTGAVVATGPIGRIEAGSLHLGQAAALLAGNGTPSYVLVFKDGVRMVYQPPKQGN